MMLSDLGDRASPPPRELPCSALEIETVDAASGAHRYAYIAAVPSPRLSPVSYVSYDPAHSSVEGGSYRMTFRGDFPIGLALKDGRGNLSSSLIEGSQVQMTARVLMLFKLRLSANGVTNRVLAWRGGPIRLIRRVSHSVKLIFGIKSPPVPAKRSSTAIVRRIPSPRECYGCRACSSATCGCAHGSISSGSMASRCRGRGLSGSRWSRGEERPGGEGLARPAGGEMARAQGRRHGRDANLRAVTRFRDTSAPTLLLRRCGGGCIAASVFGLRGRRAANRILDDRMENLAPGTHRVNSVLMVLPDSAEPDAVARDLEIAPLVNVRPMRR